MTEEKKEDYVVLYVLMRNDTESMGNGYKAGRAIAQGTHAANQMTHDIETSWGTPQENMLDKWKAQSGAGFGTCIVLSADWDTITTRVGDVMDDDGCAIAAIVTDDTYPIQDGAVTHLVKFETCAYMFGWKSELEHYTADLPLFP